MLTFSHAESASVVCSVTDANWVTSITSMRVTVVYLTLKLQNKSIINTLILSINNLSVMLHATLDAFTYTTSFVINLYLPYKRNRLTIIAENRLFIEV